MAAKREKIHFESVEELLGAPETREGTVSIPLLQIRPFKDHPFKVLDDDKMQELVASVKQNGVMTPVLVRLDANGLYEMISGHRRLHAARLAGLAEIPAIVKQLDDDAATIIMVDSNMQREEILPSERAFALKMKMDAMRRQGERTDLSTCGSDFHKLEDSGNRTSRLEVDKLSTEEGEAGTSGRFCQKLETSKVVGQSWGMSGRNVRNYIRLTQLIPQILDLIDSKRIRIDTGVEISYLSKEMQGWLAEYMDNNGAVRHEQVAALRSNPKLESMNQYQMIQALNEALPQRQDRGKITFSPRKLDRYFPASYTSAQRQDIILELLEKWKKEQEGSHV